MPPVASRRFVQEHPNIAKLGVVDAQPDAGDKVDEAEDRKEPKADPEGEGIGLESDKSPPGDDAPNEDE